MARPKSKQFCVVVVDRSRLVFSVEGPMSNGARLTERIVLAQKAGRKLTCHAMGDVTPDTAAAEWLACYPNHGRVAAGAILARR